MQYRLTADEVKILRQALGMTQTEFASFLGITAIYQQKLEYKKTEITEPYLERINNRIFIKDPQLFDVVKTLQDKRGGF
ncbi:helix-turn-helix domain-containing protein [Priestia megaterium]|uniref:helix-turn-helix domain-containing protein n=1 Tax=Priestia megaterium TaxID=1404 RepID=UPI002E20E89A|nr:hypothetical protein [Priestia megaterium]